MLSVILSVNYQASLPGWLVHLILLVGDSWISMSRFLLICSLDTIMHGHWHFFWKWWTDSSLVVHIKSMSPSEVDAEFRVMEIVDDDIDSQSQELQDIGMVLDFLLAELKSNNNFEFIQALMQLFLEVICVWLWNLALLVICKEQMWMWCFKFWGWTSRMLADLRWKCLQIHAETILSQPFLQEKAAKLWHHQTTTWQRLDTMFQRARSMISFISKTQL